MTVDEEETLTDSEEYNKKEQGYKKRMLLSFRNLLKVIRRLSVKGIITIFLRTSRRTTDGLKADYFCPGNIHLDDEGKDIFCLKVITGLSKVFTLERLLKKTEAGILNET